MDGQILKRGHLGGLAADADGGAPGLVGGLLALEAEHVVAHRGCRAESPAKLMYSVSNIFLFPETFLCEHRIQNILRQGSHRWLPKE